MKLVDILARELSAWKANADGAVFSSKGGACYFFHGNKPAYSDFNWRATTGCFWLDRGKIVFDADTPEDHHTAIVTRTQWQAAVDALKADEVSYSAENVSVDVNYFAHTDKPINPECRVVRPEWNGEGLPPVGTVCEWRDDESGPWVRVEVRYLSEFTVLLLFQNGPGDCEGAYSPSDCQFRPIRTPEQIAAEERDHAVTEMQKAISLAPVAKPYDSFLYALYDAGYRKFEIVDD